MKDSTKLARQHQYDIQSMEKQAELNLNQWKTEAEYNLPKNQVDRLRAAGLNPLFTGLDGTSAQLAPVSLSNNVDVAGTYNKSEANKIQRAANMQVLAKGFAEISNLKAQTDAANAQADNFRSDSVLKQSQTVNTNAQSMHQILENANFTRTYEANISNLDADTLVKDAQRGVFGEEMKLYVEKQLTEGATRELLGEEIKSEISDRVNKRKVADSTASYNYAAAENQRSQSELSRQQKNFLDVVNPHRVKIEKKNVDKVIQELDNLEKQGKQITANTWESLKRALQDDMSHREEKVFESTFYGLRIMGISPDQAKGYVKTLVK